MDKIIIPREENKVFCLALIPVSLMLLITGVLSWGETIFKSEHSLLIFFRILNVLSIGSISYVNILIYYPFASDRMASLEEKDKSYINALKMIVLGLAIFFCAIALIYLNSYFIFTFFVSLTFLLFYFYDIAVLESIKSKTSIQYKKLQDVMLLSLTNFTRPIFRTYSIIYLIVTTFFLIDNSPIDDSLLILETFSAGMVTFNLLSTTLIFVEQNRLVRREL